MQGLIATQGGGIIPIHGWREAPPVMYRWSRLYLRTGFEFDAVFGRDGLEHLFFYEERYPLIWLSHGDE